MTYEYKCPTCSVYTDIQVSIKDKPPANIRCECGDVAHRVFGVSLLIPKHMRAYDTSKDD